MKSTLDRLERNPINLQVPNGCENLHMKQAYSRRRGLYLDELLKLFETHAVCERERSVPRPLEGRERSADAEIARPVSKLATTVDVVAWDAKRFAAFASDRADVCPSAALNVHSGLVIVELGQTSSSNASKSKDLVHREHHAPLDTVLERAPERRFSRCELDVELPRLSVKYSETCVGPCRSTSRKCTM